MNAFIRDITGADRGFNVAADVLTATADGYPLNELWEEFAEALGAYNNTRNLFSALFASGTTDSFVQIADGVDEIGLEVQSEFGLPTAGRVTPDYFRMGYPLDWFDRSARFTRKFLRDATAEQVRAQHAAVLAGDNHQVFQATMKALTDKVPSGSRDANENGVTIYDLWDGSSGEVPPPYAGKTFTDSHTHYLVSGAATIDGGDLKALTDTIQEHGYGLRSTNEQVVIMVNPAEADVISTFRRDPENPSKDPHDFIPSVSAPAYLTDVTIVGDKAPAKFNSLDLFGSYGDAWLHKDYLVPAGYAIAVATAGPNSGRNPLLFREHPQPESRGLRLMQGINSRYPLAESVYEHGYGVGVRHRSAAAVMQIKASGSYANPVWP